MNPKPASMCTFTFTQHVFTFAIEVANRETQPSTRIPTTKAGPRDYVAAVEAHRVGEKGAPSFSAQGMLPQPPCSRTEKPCNCVPPSTCICVQEKVPSYIVVLLSSLSLSLFFRVVYIVRVLSFLLFHW